MPSHRDNHIDIIYTLWLPSNEYRLSLDCLQLYPHYWHIYFKSLNTQTVSEAVLLIGEKNQ